jgi:hypothetical protein
MQATLFFAVNMKFQKETTFMVARSCRFAEMISDKQLE